LINTLELLTTVFLGTYRRLGVLLDVGLRKLLTTDITNTLEWVGLLLLLYRLCGRRRPLRYLRGIDRARGICRAS
jgi:hypothetical protein